MIFIEQTKDVTFIELNAQERWGLQHRSRSLKLLRNMLYPPLWFGRDWRQADICEHQFRQ